MGRWQIMLVHSLGGDGGYNPVMTTDVVSSINRTKGFGDVWQDSVVNIGAYWRAQKALSTVTPTTSGMEDLDLDAPRALPSRQIPARASRWRHAQAGRQRARVGRARLLRNRARRGLGHSLTVATGRVESAPKWAPGWARARRKVSS